MGELPLGVRPTTLKFRPFQQRLAAIIGDERRVPAVGLKQRRLAKGSGAARETIVLLHRCGQEADTCDMSYNPNDMEQRRFVDSPVVADFFMILMGVALGFATWRSITLASPQYIAAALLGFFSLLCFIGVLMQKRRTFTFDATSQTMSWTSRGLRENRSGTVAFKDISIWLDSMQDKQTVLYRVMIQTPDDTWPLTNAYNYPHKQAEAKLSEMRALLASRA
jgi:hypothetical protein